MYKRRRVIVKPEVIYVLDYLPYGRNRRRGPLIQAIGLESLRLVEVKLKEGVSLEIGNTISLEDEKIDRIYGYIRYEDLTSSSKKELESFLDKYISENESKFVEFFNTAVPINPRIHQLELIPGIGKRLLWRILKEREEKKFESFEEIKKRIPQIGDIKQMIKERILEEEKNEKLRHCLFVKRW